MRAYLLPFTNSGWLGSWKHLSASSNEFDQDRLDKLLGVNVAHWLVMVN